MKKRILLALLVVPLLLSACAPALLSGSSEPYNAPMPEDVFFDESADFGGEAAPGETRVASGVPQTTERIVIRNANLSIVVDNPPTTMSDIARMAAEMGGFVVSSNMFQTTLESGVEVPRANIMVRVPADQLNDALAKIEESANQVLSRNESGEDVTREYTDLQSRLRNLEQAETQLMEIMGSANRTEDVLDVFNQLTAIREQIEIITGQIQFFEQSAAFSAITIDIVANEAVQPLTIGGWQPVGVAKNALQALINTLKFLADAAIWILIYVLPVLVILSIPLVLIGRGFRRWRNRRRERKAQVAQTALPQEPSDEIE
jgi:glycine cleavage system regulatory protein